PLTNGHTDLVRRAAGIFDKVIVAIAANAHKAPLFPLEVRVDLARRVLSDIPNVEVPRYSGLTVRLARKHQPAVIVRGLGAVRYGSQRSRSAASALGGGRRLTP